MVEQTAVKATDALLDKGVLGVVSVLLILVVIVLGWVIRHLDRKVQNRDDLLLALTKDVITVAQSSAAAGVQSALALDSIRAALATAQRAVDEMTQQLERSASESRHGIQNLSAAIVTMRRLDQEARS